MYAPAHEMAVPAPVHALTASALAALPVQPPLAVPPPPPAASRTAAPADVDVSGAAQEPVSGLGLAHEFDAAEQDDTISASMQAYRHSAAPSAAVSGAHTDSRSATAETKHGEQ